MSIKPVDYQVMIPRTAEVSKMHNDEQHKNQAMQQQQASVSQHKIDNELRQVHAQDSAQEARIRERQQRENESRKDKEERENKEKRKYKLSNYSNKTLKPIDSNSTIDVRL